VCGAAVCVKTPNQKNKKRKAKGKKDKNKSLQQGRTKRLQSTVAELVEATRRKSTDYLFSHIDKKALLKHRLLLILHYFVVDCVEGQLKTVCFTINRITDT